MKKYCMLHCPLCKRELDRETIDVSSLRHASIMKMIKKEHPEWAQENGLCPLCLDYYEKIYLCEKVM